MKANNILIATLGTGYGITGYSPQYCNSVICMGSWHWMFCTLNYIVFVKLYHPVPHRRKWLVYAMHFWKQWQL